MTSNCLQIRACVDKHTKYTHTHTNIHQNSSHSHHTHKTCNTTEAIFLSTEYLQVGRTSRKYRKKKKVGVENPTSDTFILKQEIIFPYKLTLYDLKRTQSESKVCIAE